MEARKVLQTGTANVPVNLMTKLIAAGWMGSAAAKEVEVLCMDADASSIAIGEADMATINDGRKLIIGQSYTFRAAGRDVIDLGKLNIISDGASKKFSVYVRTV